MIAVLTKADALKLPAVQELMEKGDLTMREAMPRVADLEAQMLSRLRGIIENCLSGSKYPPKAYLSMASK